jgi:hypothetical protein
MTSLVWCQAPIWGPWPNFYYCQTVADLLMWGALSDGRRVLYFTITAGILQHRIVMLWGSFSSQQSVNQLLLVSGTPLGSMTRFYLHPFFRDNYFVVVLAGCPLWWEGVYVTCSAIGNCLGSQRTNNHTLPSHLRLCSLYVASYDSQGLRWRNSNPPPLMQRWFSK